MKKLLLMIAIISLGGCAVYPVDPYYAQPVYVAPAPVYVAPSATFSFGYYGGYHRHRHGW